MVRKIMDKNRKNIVIIGGGFAGLQLAKGLKKSNYNVTLIDKNNYHTFQPLLYQVATGGLRVDSIAYPLRKVFRGASNIRFVMDEVLEIDTLRNNVTTKNNIIPFDYLVIATGSGVNYFKLDDSKNLMMTLKNPQDALKIRSYILQNFEQAYKTDDPAEQEVLMNIAIAGGGPTGVELAGAIAEMKKFIFPKNYPGLDVSKMRIALFEAGPKLLGPMSDGASTKSLQYLQGFGVEVYLNAAVDHYDGDHLKVSNGMEMNTKTLIWTAGVKGVFPDGLDHQDVVKGSRLVVDGFNRVKTYNHIFAVGDVALMASEEYPKGHPMLATVAIQQAQNLAANFKYLDKDKDMAAFEYKDKGTMATIGRNRAVVDLPFWHFQGAFAWYVWIFVHIFSIVGFKNKLSALWDWAYNFFTYDRAVQLIINPFVRPDQSSDKENIEEESLPTRY